MPEHEPRQSQAFSLLVKPASADCNLRCAYCFYLEKSSLYPRQKRHRMSPAVLRSMIASFMATEQAQYSFGWQGGEPTLMGTDFFRHAVELQQEYGKSGSVVCNGLQTNATRIDDEMARLFARYHFLLGVSLDGAEEVHNTHRRTAGGAVTHRQVIEGIRTLRRHRVEFNALVAVNARNVGHGSEIYRYLLEQDILYHQYIPIVEFDARGRPLPFGIEAEQWGEFLCAVFDEWYPRDTRRVSIRLFDSILSVLVDRHPTICSMDDTCCQYFVVEFNGDVYPCDFFVEEETRLGNIQHHSWEQLLSAAKYRAFGQQKQRLNRRCRGCRHVGLCVGDCLKHRFHGARNPQQLSWLCKGWMRFYDHAQERLHGLANEVQHERALSATSGVPSPASGRNDPCPCGSGRKYKHCHGARA